MVDLDPRIGNNFIDTNTLDSTGGPEEVAMDAILRLHDESVFTLLLPYSVQEEMEHPHTPAEVRRKAEQLVFSTKVDMTGPELATHDKVRDLIRGNARPGQHDKDAFHLVESAKYGGRHFITNDGRLLKKADEIWRMLQLRVVKPSEFLASYLAHAKEDLV